MAPRWSPGGVPDGPDGPSGSGPGPDALVVAVCCKATLFRESLAAVVRAHGHRVVCCLDTLELAVVRCQEADADVLLLDARLSDGDSLARLGSAGRRTRVLLLSHPGREHADSSAREAVDTGAADAVLDDAAALVSLERAMRGDPLASGRPRERQPRRVGWGLTARENEVASLLLAGRATEAMASTLGVSRSTVHSHVQSILRKLGARNRLEAVSIYLRDSGGDPVSTSGP